MGRVLQEPSVSHTLPRSEINYEECEAGGVQLPLDGPVSDFSISQIFVFDDMPMNFV